MPWSLHGQRVTWQANFDTPGREYVRLLIFCPRHRNCFRHRNISLEPPLGVRAAWAYLDIWLARGSQWQDRGARSRHMADVVTQADDALYSERLGE